MYHLRSTIIRSYRPIVFLLCLSFFVQCFSVSFAQDQEVTIEDQDAASDYAPILLGRSGYTPWIEALVHHPRWSSTIRQASLDQRIDELSHLTDAERDELELVSGHRDQEAASLKLLTPIERYVLRIARGGKVEVDRDDKLIGQLSLSHVWGRGPSGFLLNARKLEESPFWIKRRFRDYGTPEMLAAIKSGVEELHRRFPNPPKVMIGDLSKRYGGHFPPHVSHQSGRDADLGYFVKGPYAYKLKGLTMVNHRTIDAAKTWALLSGMLKTGLIESAFIDYRLQRVLYRHALREGEWSREELDEIFSYPLWKGKTISHLRGHSDHMHIRFKAPLSQEMARGFIRLNGRRGLKPRRRYAKPRRGETLVKMAKRYRVSWRKMMRWNRLSLAQARKPLKKRRVIVGFYTPYSARKIKFPDLLTREKKLLKSALSQLDQ